MCLCVFLFFFCYNKKKKKNKSVFSFSFYALSQGKQFCTVANPAVFASKLHNIHREDTNACAYDLCDHQVSVSIGRTRRRKAPRLAFASFTVPLYPHSFLLPRSPPPSPSPHLSPLASPHTTHEKARVQVDASNTRSGVPKQTSLDRAVKISAAWKIRC